MPKLHIIYKAVDDYTEIRSLWFIASLWLLSLLLCIGFFLIWRGKILSDLKPALKGKLSMVLFLFPVFTSIGFFMEASAIIPSTQTAQEIYRTNKMRFVEGRITEFSPMPDNGHGWELFEVNQIPFEYSKYEEGIGGYHKTVLDGGTLKKNLYVRIGYYHTDYRNIILKLETE